MGELRTGHFFAVWGDGTVGQIPLGIVANDWKAMMSIDGGEPFSASEISQAPVAEPPPPPQPLADATADTENASDPPSPEPGGVESTSEQSPQTPKKTERSGDGTPEADHRLPMPTEEARRLARELYREIFQSEYEDAVTEEEKLEFAEKIRDRADDLHEDPAGRYVLLDVSAVIAAQVGSVITALEVVEEVKRLFQTDAMELGGKVLESSAGLVLADKENDAAREAALVIMEQAIEADNFDLAARMHGVALAAARRSEDAGLVHRIAGRRKEISNAKSAFRQVAHLIDALETDASDADANLAVGEYCCLAKGQWEAGLPMLARGSDKRLARLAEQELKLPGDAHERVALADSWWAASQETRRYSEAMKHRAVYWYQQALPELEAGLERVKAEIRIKKAQEGD
jgi:hypothetical protein